MYREPEPNMLDVKVSVPVDATFAEMADVLDALTESHISVTATRLNPRYLAPGGLDINPNDLVFWISAIFGGGGLVAFSKRFFEHLADDAHDALKRQIARYRERRKTHKPSEEWHVYLLVHHGDDEPGAVSFRWDPDDDLARLGAAAMDLPEGASKADTTYAWDPKAGRWFEYDRETGRPIKR